MDAMPLSSARPHIVVALDPRGRTVVKRDFDLIKRILIELESRRELTPRTIAFDGLDDNIVTRHVELLHRAGYLEVAAISQPMAGGPPTISVTDLTWDGHEFLDAIRSDTVWTKVKAELSAANLLSVPLEVIKYAATEVAKSIVKQRLGIG